MRSLLFLLAIGAAAQEPPAVGWTLGRDGAVRRLSGIAGAFRTGAAVRDQVTQFFFDGRSGWQVRLGLLERPGGAPVHQLGGGPVLLCAAGAYQPSTGTLFTDNGAEQLAHLATDLPVLAAEFEEGVLRRVVRRGAELRIEALAVADGAVLASSAWNGPDGPLAFSGSKLLAAPADLGAAALFPIGEGWFQARGAGGDFALRLREGRWEAFAIPVEDAP